MLCQWFVVETGHNLNSLPVTSNIYLQFELPQTFTYNFNNLYKVKIIKLPASF